MAECFDYSLPKKKLESQREMSLYRKVMMHFQVTSMWFSKVFTFTLMASETCLLNIMFIYIVFFVSGANLIVAQDHNIQHMTCVYSNENITHHLQDCGSKNLFFDTSLSEARSDISVEAMLDVLTCVRPTHSIYSVQLGRYVTGAECLKQQGIWRVDSENVSVYDRMAASDKFSQDIAGNAFSSTACQASLLACFISCDVWREMQPRTPGSVAKPKPAKHSQQSPSAIPSPLLEVATHGNTVSAPSDSVSGGSAPSGSNTTVSKGYAMRKVHQGSLLPVPTRRLRVKTTLKVDNPKRKPGNNGSGNKDANGKKKMISIYEKEMILQEYDKAVQKGMKKPQNYVKKLNMKGYFRGCMFASKWGTARVQQKWSLLVSTAPELMKKHSEVPNCIRRILNMKTLKHSTATTEATDPTMEQIHMPLPLQMVVEDIIMDRICHGEEVNMQCVKSVIVFCTELWNTVTVSMRDSLQESTLKIIKNQDAALAQLSDQELTRKVDEVVQSAMIMLRPIRIAENDGALL